MFRFFTLLVSLLCLCAPDLNAQKHGFRGVWVATVANIDFPSRPGLDTTAFREEWLSMLALYRSVGLNAVFVQVRPAGDAFYRSRIAPWSQFLSGTQGQALAPGFDPLPFMIETAHANQLEFHAWLNPYRAAMDSTGQGLDEKHPYRQHPDWFVNYGGKKYFDPGIPAVRNYIAEVVLELVTDYQVDGIHFDDYFYPYPVAGEEFPDKDSFERYGFGYSSKADWRRDNTDRMIRQVAQIIKRVDAGVKFGVSPFGVWRNISLDPVNGSATRAGVNTYDDLFADVRGWLEKGWIDYVVPQLYWHMGFPAADYDTLVDWWEKNTFQRQLYIGMAAYKVGNHPEKAWGDPEEIPRQLARNRAGSQVAGEVFFNSSSLRKNPLGLTDSLRRHYAFPALWPPMPYLGLPLPKPPSLGRPTFRKGIVRIPCKMKYGTDFPPNYLLVYRFADRAPGDVEDPGNLLMIVPVNGRRKYLIEDPEPVPGDIFTYAATLTNKAYLESPVGRPRPLRIGKFLLRKTR